MSKAPACPLDLADEAVAKLIDFLLAIAHQMEDHYSERLRCKVRLIGERFAWPGAWGVGA